MYGTITDVCTFTIVLLIIFRIRTYILFLAVNESSLRLRTQKRKFKIANYYNMSPKMLHKDIALNVYSEKSNIPKSWFAILNKLDLAS